MRALPPQGSVSTNSTTTALKLRLFLFCRVEIYCLLWDIAARRGRFSWLTLLLRRLRQIFPLTSFLRFVAIEAVSYTHLRAHETEADLVCRLLLEKKKK